MLQAYPSTEIKQYVSQVYREFQEAFIKQQYQKHNYLSKEKFINLIKQNWKSLGAGQKQNMFIAYVNQHSIETGIQLVLQTGIYYQDTLYFSDAKHHYCQKLFSIMRIPNQINFEIANYNGQQHQSQSQSQSQQQELDQSKGSDSQVTNENLRFQKKIEKRLRVLENDYELKQRRQQIHQILKSKPISKAPKYEYKYNPEYDLKYKPIYEPTKITKRQSRELKRLM